MNERQPKESIMGTAEVSRLVLTTGIPLMLSLLINSLYNFVDSVFVSRVAADARYDHHHAAPGCPSGYSGARASPDRPLSLPPVLPFTTNKLLFTKNDT